MFSSWGGDVDVDQVLSFKVDNSSPLGHSPHDLLASPAQFILVDTWLPRCASSWCLPEPTSLHWNASCLACLPYLLTILFSLPALPRRTVPLHHTKLIPASGSLYLLCSLGLELLNICTAGFFLFQEWVSILSPQSLKSHPFTLLLLFAPFPSLIFFIFQRILKSSLLLLCCPSHHYWKPLCVF